jgi:hypothetical protein
MKSLGKLTLALVAAAALVGAGCQRRDDPSTNGPTGAGNASTTGSPSMGGSTDSNSNSGTSAMPPASSASR